MILKRWASGDILVDDCLLRNEALNPMINWLNLHYDEIKIGDPIIWTDKQNDVRYIVFCGKLTITTSREYAFLSADETMYFLRWLNKYRKTLKIREVRI